LVYLAIMGGVLFGAPRFLSWYLDTDYPIASITSGSMWPAFRRGDIVLIQRTERSDLKVGDIVVWQNPDGFTIHRIVRLENDALVTKGDANFVEDKPVRYDDVVGRIYQVFGKNVRLPYLGMITVYANQK
ncbi:MAG: signal peptidase I, partial [Parcubacteria group bacterium]|nr:signal peptidase I [Parcubacteria group bacterium]